MRTWRTSLLALVIGGTCGLIAAKTGVLGAKTASASTPNHASRAAAAAPAALGEGATLHFAVMDADSGKMLNAQHENDTVSLGQAHDVLVAGAAMAHLNPAFRFRTNYVAKGRLKNGVIWGDLVVEGRGDPTIDEVRTAWVAERLVSAGLTRITGKIRVDDTWYLPRPAADPNAPEDAPPPAKVVMGPYAPTGAIQFNDGRLGAGLYHRGRYAEVALAPAVYGARLTHDVRAGDFTHRPRAFAFQPLNAPPHVFVAGVVGEREGVTAPIENEAMTLGYSLLQELVRRGVKVRRRVVIDQVPSGHRWIMSNISPPLTHLLREGLARTDVNPERLFRALLMRLGTDHGDERGTPDNGAQKANAVLLEKAGLSARTIALAGDPERSQGQASAFVRTLTALFQDYNISPDLLRVLGQGGTHRDLRALFGEDHPLLPAMRLAVDLGPGYAEMSGFVKASGGRTLAVYWRADAPHASSPAFLDAQNQFLSQIVGQGKATKGTQR